jgi:hypothetical protein
MRNKFLVLIMAMLLATQAFSQVAITPGPIRYTQYGTGGTKYNSSAATNYAVISDNGTFSLPVINFISATGDATTSVIQFWVSTNFVTAAAGYTNTTTTNFVFVNAGTGVGSTNGFAAGATLVIQHVPADTYEMAFVGSVTGTPVATNISVNQNGNYTNYVIALVTQVAPSNAVVPGDIIYLEVTNVNGTLTGYIPVGVATNTLTSVGGFFVGKANKPLLMTIIGGTNATINAVNATYTP